MANDSFTHLKRLKAQVGSRVYDTWMKQKSIDKLQEENRLLKIANQDLRRRNIEQRMMILAVLGDSAETSEGFFF